MGDTFTLQVKRVPTSLRKRMKVVLAELERGIREFVIDAIDEKLAVYEDLEQGGGKSGVPDEAVVSHGGAAEKRARRRVDARPREGRDGGVAATAPVTTVGSSPTPATSSDDNRVDGLGNLLTSHPAGCKCRYHKTGTTKNEVTGVER